MSIKELSFALEQENLPIYEHLAFIVIADWYSDYFTIEQAVETITRRTHHSDTTAREAVEVLISEQLILPSTTFQGSEKLYLILAVNHE